MKNKDLVRLKHMLDSTQAILGFVQEKKEADLECDRLLLAGIVREFQILGEAAGKVSPQTQEKFPHIPWRTLIAMRNRLIHAYFDVDIEIIWMTIKNNLLPFCSQLEEAIAQIEADVNKHTQHS